jgi:LuxR family maltose regulon positive regulatory protein
MSVAGTNEAPFIQIRTKLSRPRPDADLVRRPHLLEQLRQGLDDKLTLVSAPAGYGKTTLLAQWLEGCDWPVGWLSLDERDNDMVTFLGYLVAAIQTALPGACSTTLGLLRAPQLPPPPHVAASLVNEILDVPQERSTNRFILVLDDYHAIHDEAIHEFLKALIRDLPQSMHLVLATRTDPPFALASLRAGRELVDIRAANLRFSVDEVEAFFERSVGMALPEDWVIALEERTEGWIAGLRMAAIAMRGVPDPADFVRTFRGTHRDLLEYLVAEVLVRQSQEVQQFLTSTSILDRFCAPLCEAMLQAASRQRDEGLVMANEFQTFDAPPVSRSLAIIEELERGNLFLVPLDHERSWYRYHHLFQDSLRHQLKTQLNATEITSLHRAASVWLESNGLFEEALDHSLIAGDVEGAARSVANARHRLLNCEDWATLDRYLNQLPEEAVSERPVLLVARAWVADLRHQISRIPGLLDKAEALLSAGAPTRPAPNVRDLQGEIDALRTVVFYAKEEGQRGVESARRALEHIPPAHTFARSFAVQLLALAYQMIGQTGTAMRTLSDFLAEANEPPGTVICRMMIGQTYTQMLAGNLHPAAQIARQLQQLASKTRLTVSMVVAHWLLGRISYERNHLETASRHFAAVFELRYGGHYGMIHDSAMALALTYHTQGMPDKAEETLAELRRFALEMGMADRLPEIDSFEARLALLRGDLQQAVGWAEAVHPDIQAHYFIWLEVPIETKARVLIAQGTEASLREVVKLLKELLARSESTHNTYRQIIFLACQALACEAQGRTADALEALERSVGLAQPGGFIRTFVDMGPSMTSLLYRLTKRGTTPGHINQYVCQVLAAFAEGEGEGAAARQIRKQARAGLIEPLTARESEILLLLSRRLRNKEIAQTLHISPLTVKRHTINLYQKFQVHSRTEAVTRAQELGIVPPD